MASNRGHFVCTYVEVWLCEGVKKAHCAASSCLHLLAVGDEVRTLGGKGAAWAQKIWRELKNEDGQRILHNIRLLRQRFEPEVAAKEQALKKKRFGQRL